MKKKNQLIVDNPIDILGLALVVIGMLVLFNLWKNFSNDTEYPTVASDSLTLILTRGIPGLAGIFLTRIFLCSNKGKNTSIIGNQWNSDPKDNSLLDAVFATATYFGIQTAVIILQGAGIFQVAAVDVYAFFVAAAVMEEIFFRGWLVMFCQAILAKIWKARDPTSMLIMNLFCCVVSGAVFAAAHTRYWGDPALMIITFAGGCAQAYWYIKSKNLFVPMISHCLINFVASGSVVQSL